MNPIFIGEERKDNSLTVIKHSGRSDKLAGDVFLNFSTSERRGKKKENGISLIHKLHQGFDTLWRSLREVSGYGVADLKQAFISTS